MKMSRSSPKVIICFIVFYLVSPTSFSQQPNTQDNKYFSRINFNDVEFTYNSDIKKGHVLDTMERWPGAPLIYINSCRMPGLNQFKSKHKAPGELYIHGSKIDRLLIDRSFSKVSFDYDTIGHLICNGDYKEYNSEKTFRNELKIHQGQINKLSLSWGYQNIALSNVSIKEKLHLNHVRVESYFLISTNELPDTITMKWVWIPEGTEIDLDKYSPTNKVCLISFYGVDIEKINISYRNFKLFFPRENKETYEDKLYTYQRLLNKFHAKGMSDSYEKLDREFKEFKFIESGNLFGHFSNWLSKHWWDYGYNKTLIVRNAILFNLFFFLINLANRKALMEEGYRLDRFLVIMSNINKSFPNERGIQNMATKSAYVFVYTCYIFWGLRLNIDNLSIKRLDLFFYVMLQYITGVICLAYIANLIITN